LHSDLRTDLQKGSGQQQRQAKTPNDKKAATIGGHFSRPQSPGDSSPRCSNKKRPCSQQAITAQREDKHGSQSMFGRVDTKGANNQPKVTTTGSATANQTGDKSCDKFNITRPVARLNPVAPDSEAIAETPEVQ